MDWVAVLTCVVPEGILMEVCCDPKSSHKVVVETDFLDL